MCSRVGTLIERQVAKITFIAVGGFAHQTFVILLDPLFDRVSYPISEII